MAKVVFCQRVVFAYFGVMSISAVLKKHGHNTDIVMNADIKRAADEILALKPDIVGFSALTATGEFEWAVMVCRRIKERNPEIVTIVGGIHPTLFPEESMEDGSVDAICRGEGEYPMLELCNRIDSRQSFSDVLNLWVRTPAGISKNDIRNLIEDLDELPFPDRDLYNKYNYFRNIWSVDVMAGRQCPFDCSFCYNHVIKQIYKGKGTFVRKHSVDYVIKEITDIKLRFRPKSITFQDELFVITKPWLAEFAKKYPGAIGLPFICSIRAEMVDEDVVELLSVAGASTACLGLESGNEQVRNGLLNKNITDRQLEDAAELLHKYKIKFLTANIFGSPNETIENAFETIEMNHRLKADYLYFSILQPYPGLEITKKAQTMGLIVKLKQSDYYSTFFKGCFLKQKDSYQFTNIHRLAYLAVAFPRLKPIFRQLIKLPPNFIFDLLFMIGFAHMQFSGFKKSWRQLFMVGIRNLSVFYSNIHRVKVKNAFTKSSSGL